MNKLKMTALLPMKAHSARVKGKNFRNFAGKPLYCWILESLLAVDDIDLIVINTDARSLLSESGLADNDRILIRDRKTELCGDMVSMNLVLSDDIAAIKSDHYLMTHTTNPLLRPETIKGSIDAYLSGVEKKKADSLFTVNRFQTRFYRENGSAVNHNPAELLRTQDLELWLEENSNLYLFSETSFASTNARIGRNPIMYETPRRESADIDDQEGWDITEMMASAKRRD